MQKTPLYVKPCCFTLDLLMSKCKTWSATSQKYVYFFQCASLATLSLFLKNELWTQKKEEKRKPELRCNMHFVDSD